MKDVSRALENFGFALGISLAGAYVVAEIIVRLGACFGPTCSPQGFPWGLFMMCALLVAPKMLGRATAGRIWNRVVPPSKETP
jgi:hypothetical protein